MIDREPPGPEHRAKETLRRRVLARRSARPVAQRQQAGAALVAAALGHPGLAAARRVAGYVSVGTEPPTGPLLDRLLGAGATVLLPVVRGRELDWARYEGPTGLAPAARGLREPVTGGLGPSALSGVEVALLPALAVDRDGHRLGRGGGFYDRALAAATPRPPLCLAVVYADEVLDEALPVRAHDQPVDGALTPDGVLLFR